MVLQADLMKMNKSLNFDRESLQHQMITHQQFNNIAQVNILDLPSIQNWLFHHLHQKYDIILLNMNENSQQKTGFRLVSHATKLHSLLFAKTEAQKDQETQKQAKHDQRLELQQKIIQKREDFKKVAKSNKEEQDEVKNCFSSSLRVVEKNGRKFESKTKVNKTKNWSYQEDKLYIEFLKQNANMFKYRSIKRVREIFNLLSEKMGGQRTPTQCKSYHQKMKVATQNGTIKQIISYISQKNQINENAQQVLKNEKISDIENFGCEWTGNDFEIQVKVDLGQLAIW